jgi:hypothetical protein
MNKAELEIQEEIQSARSFLALYGVQSFTDVELTQYLFRFTKHVKGSLENFFAEKQNEKIRLQRVFKLIRRGFYIENESINFKFLYSVFREDKPESLREIIDLIKNKNTNYIRSKK